MRLNNDKTRRTLVHGASLPWVASPAAGVQRRLLYREGQEQAVATSMVRYAAGSSFPAHDHPGGEEFLVLQGTFQDERGEYPAGTYVRNPPGSRHSPASAEGCVIFVRLRQFAEGDAHQCIVNPRENGDFTALNTACVSHLLFSDHNEQVTLYDCAAGASLWLPNDAGLELLVVSGAVSESGDVLQVSSWLRLPPGMTLQATAKSNGTTIWVKQMRGAAPGPAATL